MNRRRPDHLCAVMFALLAAAVAAAPAGAEEEFIVQGLFDAEAWATDDGSRLLSRDEAGRAGGGRLRLWAAGEFLPGLQGYVMGSAVGGASSMGEDVEGQTEVDLEQAFLRYSFQGPTRLVLEGGRIATPVGDFANRYFSTQNPLIGVPDNYGVAYPIGLKVSGWAKRFDYQVAMVDLPMGNEKYVPEPGEAYRPVLGVGLTPIQGLRFGLFATEGPYLGPEQEGSLPAGSGWRDYEQAVQGFDVFFSRSHFELHAEYTRSSNEVPTYDRAARGYAWYVEPKYTFTPRLFAALRLEQNDYPYIALFSWGWLAESASFYDAEVGIGWRLTPDALLKMSYRRDRWDVDEALKDMLPDGYALAAQFSYTFDIVNLFERPH